MSVIFEQNYLVLPPKQQEIWKVLHYFCRTYQNAFPSHAKIAELAGCCIRTVRTAIKKFRNYGWLDTLRRCYRSCVYSIKEYLLRINPKDKRNFLKPKQSYTGGEGGGSHAHSREDLQHELQHIEGIQGDTERLYVHQTNPSQKIQPKVKESLIPLPFPKGNKLDIQRNFPEQVIDLALESFKSYKNAMRNPLGMFYKLCGIENKKYKERKKNGI